MVMRIPCTLFGRKVKIVTVEQDISQQGLAKYLDTANSAVNDTIYGRNQCERTGERIAKISGIKGQ